MNRKPVFGLGPCFGNVIGFHGIHRPPRFFHGPRKISRTATYVQEPAFLGDKTLHPGTLLTEGPLPRHPIELIGPTCSFIIRMRYIILETVITLHVL